MKSKSVQLNVRTNCRVCLENSENMISIFIKKDNQTLAERISDCGGIEIGYNSNKYPDKICPKCMAYLDIAYKFRAVCKESDNKLKSLLEKTEKEIDYSSSPSIVILNIKKVTVEKDVGSPNHEKNAMIVTSDNGQQEITNENSKMISNIEECDEYDIEDNKIICDLQENDIREYYVDSSDLLLEAKDKVEEYEKQQQGIIELGNQNIETPSSSLSSSNENDDNLQLITKLSIETLGQNNNYVVEKRPIKGVHRKSSKKRILNQDTISNDHSDCLVMNIESSKKQILNQDTISNDHSDSLVMNIESSKKRILNQDTISNDHSDCLVMNIESSKKQILNQDTISNDHSDSLVMNIESSKKRILNQDTISNDHSDCLVMNIESSKKRILNQDTISNDNSDCFVMNIKSFKKNSSVLSSGELKYFVCEICGNVYKKKITLDSHIRWHSKKKAYKCEVCGRQFTINFQLTRHMRVHTGDKPYSCEICKRRFSDYSTCAKHRRTHTDERPFKCEMCGKRFNYSHVLKVHMTVHTGEKPHECNKCGKKFSQPHHLKAHMSSVAYQNGYCGNINHDKQGVALKKTNKSVVVEYFGEDQVYEIFKTSEFVSDDENELIK